MIDVLSSNSVNLQWNPPDSDKQNGVIQYYSIAVMGIESATTETYTTNVTSFTLSTLHPAYTYMLEIAAVTISFGPVISASLTMDEDGNYKQCNSYIHTSNYTCMYANSSVLLLFVLNFLRANGF